ncbi:MAG TPA: hypothetical protein VG325_15200 [Solirubrobacteraceae bacterium]|nr:hypothetical protein [Solirubrobacteraceae bacterium]
MAPYAGLLFSYGHEVRDDLTLEQILDMIIAIATIRGETDYVEQILQAALHGLRPAPGGARRPGRPAPPQPAKARRRVRT